ncbi:hypothetical protein ACE1SV_23460 [Streptomyces sp. E-15]
MPPGTTTPARRQGADDGEATALLVVGRCLCRQRPGAAGVGDFHAQPFLVPGDAHTDLPTGRCPRVPDGVADQFREQQLGRLGEVAVDPPRGKLPAKQRASTSGAAWAVR